MRTTGRNAPPQASRDRQPSLRKRELQIVYNEEGNSFSFSSAAAAAAAAASAAVVACQ